MNRDSIYNLIGYNGEYNSDVKKRLRKLLKKYHPDHNNGNNEVFKLLTTIREELEDKKIILIKKESSYHDDKSIEYYKSKLSILENDSKKIEVKIKKKYSELASYYDKYNALYENSINNQNDICKNNDSISAIKKIDLRYIWYIGLFIPLVIFMITRGYLWFLMLLIIIGLLIYGRKLFVNLKRIMALNKDYYKNIVISENSLKALRLEIEILSNDILSLERKWNSINDNIRFYNNQIK